MCMRDRRLSIANIRGEWWPSHPDACGVFAVSWQTRSGVFWAALHDFDDATQRELIGVCRFIDRQRGFPGAWPEGRAT
jgi:hypothetical protein